MQYAEMAYAHSHPRLREMAQAQLDRMEQDAAYYAALKLGNGESIPKTLGNVSRNAPTVRQQRVTAIGK